jgi:hypothetical protein
MSPVFQRLEEQWMIPGHRIQEQEVAPCGIGNATPVAAIRIDKVASCVKDLAQTDIKHRGSATPTRSRDRFGIDVDL